MAQRLRFNTARDLFEAFPAALEDMVARPSDRGSLEFLKDLCRDRRRRTPSPSAPISCSRREAVWWGHQCLNQLPGDTWRRRTRQLLALAEDWVRRPEEETRNTALDAGMASPTKTPGVWIALAAGWSGGSMMGPDDGAGDAASLSDGKGGQRRRARRAGPGRPQGAGRDARGRSSTWASASPRGPRHERRHASPDDASSAPRPRVGARLN